MPPIDKQKLREVLHSDDTPIQAKITAYGMLVQLGEIPRPPIQKKLDKLQVAHRNQKG